LGYDERVTNTQADESQTQNSSLVLALDVGTSSVRAALYDLEGNRIEGTEARYERALKVTREGGAEIDANEAVEQVAQTIDAVLARSSRLAERIELVAMSCFWHSLVGVDEKGNAITPVLGWADTRAAKVIDELKIFLDESETHTRAGSRLHASYWPAKLLWLKKENESVFNAAARWLSFAEFLTLRFFGDDTSSVSMASGSGLFDVRRLVWDEEIADKLGVSFFKLPSIEDERKTFTGLKTSFASRWSSLKNAVWYPATGDGAANNIGAGCATKNKASLMIGTSGAMRVLWDGEPPEKLPSALWCYRASRKYVVAGGALSDGGGLYHWMKKSLKLTNADDELEEQIAAIEPDSHGLTVLPFWAGERSTGWHSEARGAILGLSSHTQPIDILCAAMESVAYRFKLITDALDQVAQPQEIIASGGALRESPVWTQMIANVMGRALQLSDTREASSRGAVLLALEAAGKIKSIQDAPTPTGQIFEPDMSRHKLYQSALKKHQEVYEKIVLNSKF
jgi:gluconokinase